MNTGIYAIEHVASGRKYIGSAVNIKNRLADHRKMLRRGDHHNRHLQRAWTKHGENAFSFSKMLICSVANLIFYEQRCIDGYQTFDQSHGFNATPLAGSTLGVKHTDEAKAKIKAKRAMQTFSAETRAKLSESLKGIQRTSQWIAKMSAAGKRYVCSEATREKLKIARAGRVFSDATRAKMSASQKIRWMVRRQAVDRRSTGETS